MLFTYTLVKMVYDSRRSRQSFQRRGQGKAYVEAWTIAESTKRISLQSQRVLTQVGIALLRQFACFS